ncbi:lysozyme inhibitor LprI family protein [Paracoccus sp. pheM1]|uniref:lysozyme inhibitor LprI family protein n=1 Tax=Paracoccus sp. pheM1 TaxID=2831675 RepID=UPI001BDB6D77|nr:lysozyme inhibitor LprI family protein [Paracoccus sp. pheM1]MBT0778386.1 DUF1311 domain-containing protein [Paracoccus sp. pheM1]
MRALALFLLMAAPALAQDGPGYDGKPLAACLDRMAGEGGDRRSCIGAASGPCMDQPGGQTTAGMVQCLTAEAADWDRLLNRWYSAAMNRAEAMDAGQGDGQDMEEAAPVLKQAQRNWIAFRDESCRFEALRYQGSTMRGIAHAGCMMQLSAEQALRLRVLAEEEG